MFHSTSSYLFVCFLLTVYEQRQPEGMHIDTVVVDQGDNKGDLYFY